MICPRCGYDLRGETSGWATHCPLEGRCVECGLTLRWRDVFAHERTPWLFEAEWRSRPARRLALTVAKALNPWRFWRDAKLTDTIRIRVPLGLTAAFLLVGAFAYLGLRIAVEHKIVVAGWQAAPDLTGIYWIDLALRAAARAALLLELVIAPAIMLLGMPIAFLLVPVTLRRMRVRRVHVVRIWLYSLFVPLAVSIAWSLARLAARAGGLDRIDNGLNPWMWMYDLDLVSVDEHPIVWVLVDMLPALAIGLLLAAWLAIWWWCACRKYLDMPGSAKLVMVLILIVSLTALVAQLLVSGRAW